MIFNPLNYPSCFNKPDRLTDITSWHEHIPFAFTIIQMLKPKIFVELGTHKGDSYCAFCQAVNILGLDTACYAVDTWEGDEHSGFYGSEILEELKTYHDSLYKGFSQLIQSRFEEALDYFSDGSIDLIHIDGCHTYDAIKHDFEAWLPKMSQHGVVLLHDINVHEMEFGVWKFWEEVVEHYPCFEFKHGHGLGVLAVGSEVPEELLTLLNMGEQEVVATTKLYSYFGDKIALGHQLEARDTQITELNDALQARDTQITELNDALQARDTQITELNNALQARDTQITELNNALQARDTQITELNNALQARDTQITELNGALQAKDTQITELNGVLQTKDTQITELNDALQARDTQITELNGALQAKDTQITELNGVLQTRDTQITELNGALQARDTQITELNGALQARDAQITELNSALQSMQQSIVWRLLMKFHCGFVERVLPHGTRRRGMYDLGLRGGGILVGEGWRSFWWQYKNYRNSKRILYKNKIDLPKLDTHMDISSENTNPIDKKVSIVIPTKNGGSDFEYTLEKIRSQEGINEIEIIVVDSGSTDKTIELAENYGSQVYTIKPEDFNHGGTRNYGAEKATGDYILFMVQDAIPIGNYWLYNMVKVLEDDEGIAALTCRQVPRSDADLFSSYTMWNHYRTMEFKKDTIVKVSKEEFKKLSGVEKRMLAGIDNVCSCISKDVFNEFKFEEVNFAEDVNLGIRLLENGYKLGFLYSVGVIHSHERDSAYFLKRYYVDSKSLIEMFDTTSHVKEHDIDLVLSQIFDLYNSLKLSISTVTSKDETEMELNTFFSLLKDKMRNEAGLHTTIEYPKNLLEKLLSDFDKICDIKPVDNNHLYKTYFKMLDDLYNYFSSISQKFEIIELVEASYKLFAICCGSYLGELYSHQFNRVKMREINLLLTEGV